MAREIPADVVFENDRVIAIRDIKPQAPVHMLVIPKTAEYHNVTELGAGNPELLVEIVEIAGQLADEHTGGQYRLVFNQGERAGQTVFHVHAHVLGSGTGGTPLEEGSLGSL